MYQPIESFPYHIRILKYLRSFTNFLTSLNDCKHEIILQHAIAVQFQEYCFIRFALQQEYSSLQTNLRVVIILMTFDVEHVLVILRILKLTRAVPIIFICCRSYEGLTTLKSYTMLLTLTTHIYIYLLSRYITP